MKKFLLGFVFGIFLGFVLCFFLQPNPKFRIEIGRLLDKDTIYLKDGSVMEGWIVKEVGNEIVFETESGTFTLRRGECKDIKKDKNLYYLRKLM